MTDHDSSARESLERLKREMPSLKKLFESEKEKGGAMKVTVDRGPISAQDAPNDVPQDKWGMLVRERRSFLRTRLPYDCRELLRFITEARQFNMIEKLGYADEEDFIRRGLDLDPTTVPYTLETLRLIKPEWAMPYDTAVTVGKALLAENGQRGKAKSSDNVRPFSLGKQAGNGVAYIRARLERDGKTDLLAQVERGEMSAHAAAVEAGIRQRLIQVAPTVDGFLRAAMKHLSAAEVRQLATGLMRISSEEKNHER
jgi:hypothetical protein